MTLGGFIAIRNGDLLDYCWEIAAQSLLNCCDSVVICDCDSTDGTREKIEAWAKRDPKITVANFPWTDPNGDIWWWVNFLNYARQHLHTDWCIGLDADEVLHENSYAAVRHAANQRHTLLCQRLNFWRDAASLIPKGKCCGHEVLRVGSAKEWMPSDYPDPRAEKMMRLAKPSPIEIYHYGFLRKREAFFRKAHEVLRIWANTYDARLDNAETQTKDGGNWMTVDGVTGWENELVPFTGKHPELIKPWLRERNYAPN